MRAAARTAVSSFVQQLAEHAYALPVVRILNGLEMSAGLPAPSASHRPPHFVFVGRFSQQKQPHIFIEALALIASRSWRATLIGDGPLMPMVRELIARHGLWHRIALPGWLAAEEVQRTLAESDALVLPSLSEGLPVAGIEALRHGLALVVSDSPGMRDLIEIGVNGFDFSVCNARALAHKLRWLLESPETLLAMKHASWKKARAFDLRGIVEEYEGVLRAAAGNAQEGRSS
jgi:glycosyltransferase involved in cell wall biosynthesis